MIRQYETPMCIFTLFREDGKEFWHCNFKSESHPVNKKIFRMSGQPMRQIDKVFIHCSASDHESHDDISVIRKWHVEERHFNDIGYHYFIKKSGEIQTGRPLDKVPAAQKGHNEGSIAICLSGLDHFTEKQFKALKALCHQIDTQHTVTFHGHREVSNKTCPNFNYKEVLDLDSDGKMKHPELPKIFNKKPNIWERIGALLDKLSFKGA